MLEKAKNQEKWMGRTMLDTVVQAEPVGKVP